MEATTSAQDTRKQGEGPTTYEAVPGHVGQPESLSSVLVHTSKYVQ